MNSLVDTANLAGVRPRIGGVAVGFPHVLDLNPLDAHPALEVIKRLNACLARRVSHY